MAKEKRSATIATHHGTKVSIRHNRRDPEVVTKEDHIDLSRPHEVWHEKPLEQVYEECFGDAIREYDAGQKRASRRIGGVQGYMEQIQRERAEAELYNEKAKAENKAHENDPGWKPKRPKAAAALVYEEIAGIYQQGGPELTTDEKKALLKEYADGWQQRNPSMALVGVYYHEDEEGKDPHLHIDYVPVGTGYQRGPKVQNCLERACNAMGYKSMGVSATAQIQWQAAENDFLQKLCEAHDIEVLRPQAGKKSKHKSTAQYKLEQRLKEAEAKLKDMEAKVKEVEEKNAKLEERNAELEERNAELEEMTDGFLPKLVYGRAKKRQANAEKAADEADARRAEAETQRDEAQKKAEEARQSVEDAQADLEAIQKDRSDAEAAVGVLKADMERLIKHGTVMADQLQKTAAAVPDMSTATVVLNYMRTHSFKGKGETMFDTMYKQAAADQRKKADQVKQAGKDIESLIAKTKIPGKKHRVQEVQDIENKGEDDYGLSL